MERIEAGQLGQVSDVDELFRDPVHLSDTGNYLLALIMHTAVFGESPLGLPNAVRVEGGETVQVAGATAAAMQQLVWDVLPGYARLGL